MSRWLHYFCVALCMLLCLPLSAQDQNQEPVILDSNPRILIIGDSLSAAYGMEPKQGWVSLLEKKLHSEYYFYSIINLSTSGDTSSNGLTKLAPALKEYKPKIVILGLGSNDGLRGLSVEALKKNLEQMIQMSQAVNAKVLLIGFLIPSNYGEVYRKKFQQVFSDLAKKYKINFVPFLLENIALQTELMQADGLHPNANAQSVILKNVWPYLQPLL